MTAPPFWAEIDVTPITDDTGMPTQWVAIQRDVTERREHEAARLRHEASFRMLFEDNPLAMVVVERDSLAFIEVNDAAVAQYGWTREELLGRTLVELDPDRDEQHARSLATGQLGAAASTTHMRDDGSVLEVRAMVHDTVHAGQDATLAVLWDVTDLEAARRDMHHANEMLRERTLQLHARTDELAEAQRLARLGTWRISADRKDVSWSREMFELMGVPREPTGPGADALMQRVHEDDRETVRQALAAAGRERQPRTFEYRVTLRDNQIRHLRAEVRPVLDERGEVVELFGYSQDISALKHAEQALLRNEQLRSLGQLTGGVAHDFNNLLTVVILNLEEALEIAPEGDEMQEILAPALHAAVRGAELTSQLLSYARRATLRPERVRPDEFFGALRPLLNRVLGERFELQVLLRHNGGSAMVDPAQLDSAVMNLVINARDAMPNGGAITLETRSVMLAADSPGFQDEVTPGRYVVISVGDRGQGIPPDILPRIFEPFFTTKAVGKGSGMGLSMVYGFARQSGGHVTVESTEGVGTTVPPLPARGRRRGNRGRSPRLPRRVVGPGPARPRGRGPGERARHRDAHAAPARVRPGGCHVRRRRRRTPGPRRPVRPALQRHRPARHHGRRGPGRVRPRPLPRHPHPADLGLHRTQPRRRRHGAGRRVPDEALQAPGPAVEVQPHVPTRLNPPPRRSEPGPPQVGRRHREPKAWRSRGGRD